MKNQNLFSDPNIRRSEYDLYETISGDLRLRFNLILNNLSIITIYNVKIPKDRKQALAYGVCEGNKIIPKSLFISGDILVQTREDLVKEGLK